jgi:hypothetical protein
MAAGRVPPKHLIHPPQKSFCTHETAIDLPPHRAVGELDVGHHQPDVLVECVDRRVQGDVLVLPAGTGHCNAGSSDDLLVVGAYPNGMRRDPRRGDPAERDEVLANIAAVPLPDTDPVHGQDGPLNGPSTEDGDNRRPRIRRRPVTSRIVSMPDTTPGRSIIGSPWTSIRRVPSGPESCRRSEHDRPTSDVSQEDGDRRLPDPSPVPRRRRPPRLEPGTEAPGRSRRSRAASPTRHLRRCREGRPRRALPRHRLGGGDGQHTLGRGRRARRRGRSATARPDRVV